MKNFLKILILPIAVIIILAGGAPRAFAGVTPLSVQFVPDPLFNQTNFLPLDEASGAVTVTNNSGATQNILAEAINVSDNDNFGSLLRLEISSDNGIIFNNSLADFFSAAGEFPLGVIPNGEAKTFTFTISFINSNDNSYQGKTLGFDICVGFQGGNSRCGNTVVGNEAGNESGGIAGTGNEGENSGSNGSSGGRTMVIFNEQVVGASIIWTTSVLSTSQVIYGLASGSPYTLTLTPPNFGYPLATIEDPTKVANHAVLLTGLIPGETYVYRVVSRASPPTISFERQFTAPWLAPARASGFNFIGSNPPRDTTDINTNTAGNISEENVPLVGEIEIPWVQSVPVAPEKGLNPNRNLASVFTSDLGGRLFIPVLVFLAILLIFYIIWKLRLRVTARTNH
ncbi:MAG: fibronectin type III domain-containing protein [Candidatus Vogelbacteria bacterium]